VMRERYPDEALRSVFDGRHSRESCLRADRVKAEAPRSGVEPSESRDAGEHRITLSGAGR
jgi:hypothetical protein